MDNREQGTGMTLLGVACSSGAVTKCMVYPGDTQHDPSVVTMVQRCLVATSYAAAREKRGSACLC